MKNYFSYDYFSLKNIFFRNKISYKRRFDEKLLKKIKLKKNLKKVVVGNSVRD